MAVIGKQLMQAFYGQQPVYSYWNGCSTGGRQGLMMAQRFPGDYDGILAGAPAIHWDRFQAAQIWPQVAMLRDNGANFSTAKKTLATNAAVAACDLQDGVEDGVLDRPARMQLRRTAALDARRHQRQLPHAHRGLAINKMWNGPVSCTGDHQGAVRQGRRPTRRATSGSGTA